MDFHALEAMQCMVERRKGGETGVKAVQLITGDAVWKAGERGRWSRELLEAALSRSDSLQGLTVTDGRTQNLVSTGDELRRLARQPAAYCIEYADGTHATLLMLNGAVARLHVRRQVPRLGIDLFDSVPPASQSQRRLLSLPDAQGRGNDRNRPSTLPGRTDTAGERDARELSRLEDPGRPPGSKRRIWTFVIGRPQSSQFCQT